MDRLLVEICHLMVAESESLLQKSSEAEQNAVSCVNGEFGGDNDAVDIRVGIAGSIKCASIRCRKVLLSILEDMDDNRLCDQGTYQSVVGGTTAQTVYGRVQSETRKAQNPGSKSVKRRIRRVTQEVDRFPTENAVKHSPSRDKELLVCQYEHNVAVESPNQLTIPLMKYGIPSSNINEQQPKDVNLADAHLETNFREERNTLSLESTKLSSERQQTAGITTVFDACDWPGASFKKDRSPSPNNGRELESNDFTVTAVQTGVSFCDDERSDLKSDSPLSAQNIEPATKRRQRSGITIDYSRNDWMSDDPKSDISRRQRIRLMNRERQRRHRANKKERMSLVGGDRSELR